MSRRIICRWRHVVWSFNCRGRADARHDGRSRRDDRRSVVGGAARRDRDGAERRHEPARSAMTDERGHFLIPALPPGTYDVRAELQGFAPRTLEDVVLTLGSLLDVRLTLNVAGGQEIVLVAGDAPVIDPQRTVVSSVISQEQIQHLPINGRNFIGFSLLAPGVATDRTPQQGASGTSGSVVRRPARAIEQHHGRRARQQRFDHRQRARDVQPGGGARVPGAHQLVFGRVRQGVRRRRQHRDEERHEHDGRQSVLLSARRGAEFEGSLRAVQSGGQAIDRDKAPYSQKQYGATLGGPLKRDRTFYFLSFERLDIAAHNFVTIDDTNNVTFLGQNFGTPAAILRRAGFAVETGHVPVRHPVEPVSRKNRSSAEPEQLADGADQLGERPQREHRAVRRQRRAQPRRRARQRGHDVRAVASVGRLGEDGERDCAFRSRTAIRR